MKVFIKFLILSILQIIFIASKNQNKSKDKSEIKVNLVKLY